MKATTGEEAKPDEKDGKEKQDAQTAQKAVAFSAFGPLVASSQMRARAGNGDSNVSDGSVRTSHLLA